MEAAKAGFDRQREVLVQTEEAAGAALEHAFDFMEQAFENGEEMVVFVTELTITSESARFLSGAYLRALSDIQQTALIGTRRAELLSELRRDNWTISAGKEYKRNIRRNKKRCSHRMNLEICYRELIIRVIRLTRIREEATISAIMCCPIDHVQGDPFAAPSKVSVHVRGGGSEVPGGSLPDEMPQAGSVRLSAASVRAGT